MLATVSLQAVFAVLFVYRFVRFGHEEYTHDGAWRVVYSLLMISHEPIAVVSVPLVIVTVGLALAGQFSNHGDLARMTLPIWMYSSVTGVLIYLLLY